MHYTLWPLGDQALLVRLREHIGLAEHRTTQRALQALRTASVPGVRAVTASYTSLCVEMDIAHADPARIEARIAEVLDLLPDADAVDMERPFIDIGTHYGGSDGPDLGAVAELTGLSTRAVIDLHAGAEYRVAMLGFLPGFPYLLGLPEALQVPRLESPRARVAPGSVAIAGAQAGIYSQESPGGWRVIGRTEAWLFDPTRSPPHRLSVGDRVRFVPL